MEASNTFLSRVENIAGVQSKRPERWHVWVPPYEVDITSALRPAPNKRKSRGHSH